ncbi:hypothetical protein ABZW11_26565 [Nonomuraea sp. NPDC004580]|uniref:hypothetical protein n=1 Tax=Nonomuraea sp. NPDC004580 TaxID=3154552 RepID=UPI00339DBDF1
MTAFDRIPLPEAAELLRRSESTLRVWGTRYKARRVKVLGRVHWDYADLATIDGCIRRGEPVPATPEERDRVREGLRTRWEDAA